MEANILSVRDIRKSFGNLRALDGITLDVPEKKISILIGPNGSGKTTLINVISGLYSPDAGKIIFEESDGEGVDDTWLARTIYSLGPASILPERRADETGRNR